MSKFPEDQPSTLEQAAQLAAAARRLEIAAEDLREFHKSIKDDVAIGVQEGIKALSKDTDFGEAFWSVGFETLSRHASNHTSQWVGKRLLTAFVIAVTGAGITWLVKSGRL